MLHNKLNNLTIPVVGGTILFGLLATFIILFLRLYFRNQLKHKLERQVHRNALLSAEMDIREETLAEVSRELHDNLGHIASLVKINLGMLAMHAATDQKNKFDETIDHVRHLISDIRSLSTFLDRDAMATMELSDSIVAMVASINHTGNIVATYQWLGPTIRLNPQTKLFIFRICQESLNNVMKHAAATKVEITITCTNENLKLEIIDNGKGVNNPSRVAGFAVGRGLKNIAARCKLINADFSIGAAPGQGTRISVSLSQFN